VALGGEGTAGGRTSSRSVARALTALACVLYGVLAAHRPLALYLHAAHDDALYLRLGRALAAGRWLGDYTDTTLVKGPGYPWFLAANAWLGLPLSVSHALLHIGAALFLGWVVRRLTSSRTTSALVFGVFLTMPMLLTTDLLRVERDAIYADQVALALGALTMALLAAGRTASRAGWGALAGLLWGWTWLTREEGPWLLPALTILALGAALHARREEPGRRAPRLSAPLLAFILCWTGFQGAVRFANHRAYGVWADNEIRQGSFGSALSALQSVEAGERIDHVPMSRASRRAAYAASPAFARLEPYLDPPGGPVWQYGCKYYPWTCGEIAGGWFLWAVRDAAFRAGVAADAVEAESFYHRLAREIDAACAAGTLRCRPSPLPLIPVPTPEQRRRAPAVFAQALGRLASLPSRRDLASEAAASTGSEAEIESALRFLGRPPSAPRVGSALRLGGWFDGAPNQWFRARVVSAAGVVTKAAVRRVAAAPAHGAPAGALARRGRFLLVSAGDATSTLEIRSRHGVTARVSLAELLDGRHELDVGRATLHIDEVEIGARGAGSRERLAVAARAVAALVACYRVVTPALLGLGSVAAVVALVAAWRRRRWDAALVLALAIWSSVGARLAILVLIDLTLFPGLIWHYLAPAQYLALVAALLSLRSAVVQWRAGPGRGARGAPSPAQSS
jgi:hypothetical protein